MAGASGAHRTRPPWSMGPGRAAHVEARDVLRAATDCRHPRLAAAERTGRGAMEMCGKRDDHRREIGGCIENEWEIALVTEAPPSVRRAFTKQVKGRREAPGPGLGEGPGALSSSLIQVRRGEGGSGGTSPTPCPTPVSPRTPSRTIEYNPVNTTASPRPSNGTENA